MRITFGAAAVVFVLLVGTRAWADTISWTNWTAATLGAGGSATGTLLVDGSPVTVTYTGNLEFASLGGSAYWSEGTPAPYTNNAVIDNGPLGQDMLGLNVAATHTLTFSQALLNPVMPILSLGRQSPTAFPVTYDFDTSFTVLSEGAGYWGNGYYTTGPGDLLTGYEFHGAIQFSGSLTSISWTSSPSEWYHGIQIGVAATTPETEPPGGTTDPVPEPASVLLLTAGIAGLALRRRRRVA